MGYYFCDSKYDGPFDLNPVSKRIADKLADRFPLACALSLNNNQLAKFTGVTASTEDVCPFEMFLRDASKSWKRISSSSTSEAGPRLLPAGGRLWKDVSSEFLQQLNRGVQDSLRDFDEHLDDAQNDYMNSNLL